MTVLNLWLVPCILLLAFPSQAKAQTYAPNAVRPKQLPPLFVKVYVEGDSTDVVSADVIRTSIELRLRQNGIEVRASEDTVPFPPAVMYFTVLAMFNAGHTQRSYRADFYVEETAKLLRSPIYTGGRTWVVEAKPRNNWERSKL